MNKINIKLRKLQIKDLESYRTLNYPDEAYHEYNGTFYSKESKKELDERVEKLRQNFLDGNLSFISNSMY